MSGDLRTIQGSEAPSVHVARPRSSTDLSRLERSPRPRRAVDRPRVGQRSPRVIRPGWRRAPVPSGQSGTVDAPWGRGRPLTSSRSSSLCSGWPWDRGGLATTPGPRTDEGAAPTRGGGRAGGRLVCMCCFHGEQVGPIHLPRGYSYLQVAGPGTHVMDERVRIEVHFDADPGRMIRPS